MIIKKFIPNFLTSLNLVAGCLGIILVLRYHDLKNAAYLMWLAGIFDFFDGFAARLLGVNTGLGKQLDSLADMVTFGVLPSVMVYVMLENSFDYAMLPYFAIIIAVFSAWRLAKFNIDERQTDYFLGLPTPANAVFYSGLVWWLEKSKVIGFNINWPIILLFFTLVLSILMVTELKILAFKFKDYSLKNHWIKYLFILISIIMLGLFGYLAISPLIIFYIILSFFPSGPNSSEQVGNG